MNLVQRFKGYLSNGGWWSGDLEEKGQHLQRNPEVVKHWIAGFFISAFLIITLGNTRGCDQWFYSALSPGESARDQWRADRLRETLRFCEENKVFSGGIQFCKAEVEQYDSRFGSGALQEKERDLERYPF